MKQDLIRGMIKKEIKSSLKEASTRSQVDVSLDRIEKMAGVKMLKKALGQGSVMQQAAGLLAVVQAISGENVQVGKALARMLMKKGIATGDAGMPAGAASKFEGVEENKALDTKLAKVDKTQAMVQLKNQLGNKSAAVQSDFVLNLLNGLDLKDSAKQRLKMKIRQDLK